jgi:hypothetical protein
MDVKNIKSHLQWWEKHESMFFTIGFLAQQILGIVESQNKMKTIFFQKSNPYQSTKMSSTIQLLIFLILTSWS